MSSRADGAAVNGRARTTFWKIWVGGGSALIVLYFAVMPRIPQAVPVDYFLISAGTAACIFVGVRLHRPRHPWIWYLLGAGMASWAIGDGIFDCLTILGAHIPYPSASDPFFLMAYPLFGAGLLLANRKQSTGSRTGVLVEAGIITVGASMLSWILLMKPYIEDPSSPWLSKLVTIAYPVGDLFLLGVLTTRRSARRSPSSRFLQAWLPLLLVTDTIYAVMVIHGSYVSGSWIDGGWLIGYVLLGAAALHPSMAAPVTEPKEQPTTRSIGRLRMALLTVGSLAGPALIVFEALEEDKAGAIDLIGVASGCAILAILVLVRIMGLVREADARRHDLSMAMDQLSHLALHDPLTGLANRTLFGDRVAHGRARADRRESGLALLLIDLDDFKAVNDGMGHVVGDELLIAVAARLQEATRDSDTVARLGGDEFAILLEDEETLSSSVKVAERVLAKLATPFDVGGRTVFIGASIGIARHEAALGDADMLRNADVAMYMAKAAGKGRYVVFEHVMGKSAVTRIELEGDMREALETDPSAFAVHYQPIVDLSSNDIAGLEALVRWTHPSRGLLLPNDFLLVAEETGLIVPLGRLVLREACRQVGAWRRSIPGMRHLTVSVNLSSRQVEDGELQRDVERALVDTGLEPEALILELTEDLLLKDADTVAAKLNSLSALGVRISVDDFGSGNSSLSYLMRFPISELKIDKSCVDNLAGVNGDPSLVRGLVHLGRAIHLRMVAEGIEEPEQAAALRAMGCESGQGFLFARPRPAEEIADLLLAGVGPEHANVVKV